MLTYTTNGKIQMIKAVRDLALTLATMAEHPFGEWAERYRTIANECESLGVNPSEVTVSNCYGLRDAKDFIESRFAFYRVHTSSISGIANEHDVATLEDAVFYARAFIAQECMINERRFATAVIESGGRTVRVLKFEYSGFSY